MAFGHDTNHKDTCGDCGMDIAESSCCKDEALLLKVYDGHHPSTISFNFFKFLSDPNFHFSGCNFVFLQAEVKFSVSHRESYFDWQTNKRYARFRVFRV